MFAFLYFKAGNKERIGIFKRELLKEEKDMGWSRQIQHYTILTQNVFFSLLYAMLLSGFSIPLLFLFIFSNVSLLFLFMKCHEVL